MSSAPHRRQAWMVKLDEERPAVLVSRTPWYTPLKETRDMVKTVTATFHGGQLALAEPLPLKDGERVRVTVESLPDQDTARKRLLASAGGWADLLDCDEFERLVYERRHRPRPPARL